MSADANPVKTPRLPLAPILVLLLLLLPAGIYSLSNLSSMTDWLKHTDKVRVSLARVLSTLVDAETGNRGYVLVIPSSLSPTIRRPRSGRLTLTKSVRSRATT